VAVPWGLLLCRAGEILLRLEASRESHVFRRPAELSVVVDTIVGVVAAVVAAGLFPSAMDRFRRLLKGQIAILLPFHRPHHDGFIWARGMMRVDIVLLFFCIYFFFFLSFFFFFFFFCFFLFLSFSKRGSVAGGSGEKEGRKEGRKVLRGLTEGFTRG